MKAPSGVIFRLDATLGGILQQDILLGFRSRGDSMTWIACEVMVNLNGVHWCSTGKKTPLRMAILGKVLVSGHSE